MATSDLNLSSTPESPSPQPQVKLRTMFRLGLFQMGLGVMSILTLGVLNRVMISELGIPATVAAGTLALHQFVAPARVWFGQLSDAKPIFNLHRSGYVWVGTVLFTLTAFVAVQVMWQLGDTVRDAGGWVANGDTLIFTILLGLIFIFYGLALSFSSTPFAALLVDVSEEENRSKLVGTVWSMLMVGIVIGGVSGGILLQSLQQEGVIWSANVGSLLLSNEKVIQTPLETLKGGINRLFIIVPLVVLGLAFLATWGVEKKYSRYTSRSTVADREDSVTLGRAIRVLTASRQTGLFFSFLIIMTISLFMQEAVLEPYGGEVFDLPISQTTQLNAFWGLGTLIGVSSTGFTIAPRLGKQNTTRLGCVLVAGSFVLIILSGFTQEALLLKSAVFLFGLAAGLTTTGAISLMLDLTAAETAGTFIGAWGLAQALARALATVIGGVVLDLGKVLFSTPVLAYGLVFGLQALGMLGAIALLNRVNVSEFQTSTNQAIATVMEGDLDG
ncbi:PUCC protein [Halothece sp. PCC 7418]|uniref:BCD family MFS transporter n=1 Tax=Halothece sp. (strain PCC 7418) TaxID=65093 RepID=UPI0002A068CF|nr:BCD family MFS transporter [Halothece sp. PCC 7418]AFZ43640.1 PUCC protein [Halothece sp. PCC 7418]